MSNTILIVEDNQMTIELIISAFNDKNIDADIRSVNNGKEALDYIFGKDKYSARNNYPLPGIILLDLDMPGVNGFEVLDKVKNTPELKRIPIVIFTSSKKDEDIKKCLDLGANSYIRKPISFQTLVDTIESIYFYWNKLNIIPVFPEEKLSMF